MRELTWSDETYYGEEERRALLRRRKLVRDKSPEPLPGMDTEPCEQCDSEPHPCSLATLGGDEGRYDSGSNHRIAIMLENLPD